MSIFSQKKPHILVHFIICILKKFQRPKNMIFFTFPVATIWIAFG